MKKHNFFKVFFVCLIFVLLGNFVNAFATSWVTNTTYNLSNQGIDDIMYSVSDYGYGNQMIIGDVANNPDYGGFNWNGTSWVANSTASCGLADKTYPSIVTAEINGVKYAWTGGGTSATFTGYQWNGACYVANSTLNLIYAGSGNNLKGFIFQQYNRTQIIAIGGSGKWNSSYWNNGNWVLNTSIVVGFPVITAGYQTPIVIFNYSNAYYAIYHYNKNWWGWNWNGGTWVQNQTVVSGLPNGTGSVDSMGMGLKQTLESYKHLFVNYNRDAVTTAYSLFLTEAVTDITPPNFNTIINNGTNAKYGESVQFNFTVTDDIAISNIIFSTNMSGTWSNYTYFVASGTSYVYQYNITNNRTRGDYICALVYANDSSNNFNNSIGNCFTVQNTLPILYTYLPLNNAHSNLNLTANFSVIDVDSDIVSCYLFVNNTINATILSASFGGNLSINATGMNEGNYSWFVGCNDTLSQLQNSSVYNYVIDLTNPIETSVNMPLNDNSSRGNTNLTLNITGFDTYLYGYNLSVYYSNNSLFFNETRVNLSVQSYTLNQQINFSVQDNYTIMRCWSDSHTNKEMKDAKSVSYDLMNKKINYEFDKTQINIWLLNSSNMIGLKTFDTLKLKDRYIFTYDFNNDKTGKENTYIFRVVSTEKIYLINSKYPAHSVTGKYWIDFDIPNSKVEVINYGEKFYDVRVTTKENKLITNSIGGLNEICYSGTYRYEKYAPFAPIIYVPINITYDTEIGILYSNATSPNNDEMVYYAIDLLDYSGAFISVISANNSLNTYFLLDTINLSEGSYRINVSVFDTNGYTNQSISDVFTIYHNAWHIPPFWYDFVNNGTLLTNVSDVVQFNITFEDNLQLLNYTFYINGVEYSNGSLTGTIQNVSINYTTGNFSAGINVCGSFIVYDNNSNSNTTSNSCYTIYTPPIPPIFALDSYGAFMFIAMVILVFGLLFFAEFINSPAMRFISSIALIGFSIMIYPIQNLIGGVLIGIGLLLILRAFLWK